MSRAGFAIDRWGFDAAWLLAAVCRLVALAVTLCNAETRPDLPRPAPGTA